MGSLESGRAWDRLKQDSVLLPSGCGLLTAISRCSVFPSLWGAILEQITCSECISGALSVEQTLCAVAASNTSKLGNFVFCWQESSDPTSLKAAVPQHSE